MSTGARSGIGAKSERHLSLPLYPRAAIYPLSIAPTFWVPNYWELEWDTFAMVKSS